MTALTLLLRAAEIRGMVSVCAALALTAPALRAAEAGTVALDETSLRNLRLETVDAEETEFEETVFALGRIEAIPGNVSAVSSRIPGRIVALNAVPGDFVEEGETVAMLESRQPGNPPPVVPLKAAGPGLVTKGGVPLGAPLEPETTLMEITDLGSVYAVARLPEGLAGRVAPGTPARIRVVAVQGGEFEATLLRFGTESDRESGTVEAVFALSNNKKSIRPGMRAEFSIVVSRRDGVTSVPREALQGDGVSRFVFVRDFELANVFHKAPVEVGQINDKFVEILSGLFPGDSVVTRGAYALSFAGGGTMSLKEVLDAAHGHEHAADGSELTGAETAENHDYDDHEGAGGGGLWKVSTAVLAVLLALSLLRGRTGGSEPDEASSGPAGQPD